MVLSRNDKRKRKEGDLVDLMEPLSESPKRTKVHAQRKFAQGVATIFGPPHTTIIKEKEKAKPAVITELITHRRPNTEDFLTFLCFRGTPILPPSLDFFNVGNRKEKQDQITRSNNSTKNNSSSSTTDASKPTTNGQKSNGKNVDKKTTMHKSIAKYKTATLTVQALKKKYQEQRLAKQRIKNKFKPTCVMRTRSSTDQAKVKTASSLPSRKFLAKVETKRHCLRSSALANKGKSAGITTKRKLESPKPKKRSFVKEKSNDSSNTDVSSDENSPTLKNLRSKRQNKIPKKICTRSKSEMRRITRSHREPTQPQVLSRRPSRKTKEAAAVYMEILGRKLVSPDLDNEDNLSLDSFPELPNARRIAQTENEIRAKVKQTSKLNGNSKDTKSDSGKAAGTRLSKEKDKDKEKVERKIVKSKRPIKVQKYCELDSEDESACSEQSENMKPVTRRSLGKLPEPSSRSLRSSPRNIMTKSQSEKPSKPEKDKTLAKRKREQNQGKVNPSKNTVTKQKSTRSKNKSDSSESEEETLGMLLDKLNKKKVKSEQVKAEEIEEMKSENVPPTNVVATKYEASKISDDEESFRGFSSKAISKVLNSCHTHVKANLLASEADADGKLDVLKTQDTPQTDTSDIRNDQISILETSVISPVTTNPNYTLVKPVPEDLALSDSKSTAPAQPLVSINTDKLCIHEPSESTVNIIDMPRSATLGRKERVNMSTEQIEKWLNESSMAKEESKAEMENVAGFKYENTVKVKSDVSHLSISNRIQHLVRPVNISLAKTTEKISYKHSAIQSKNTPLNSLSTQYSPPKQQTLPPNRNKINADIKEIIKGRNNMKTSKDSSFGDESDAVSKSDHNSVDGFPEKKSPEKKSVQLRKPFLPKVKERKDITPSANAFSPENESSVYAFESDTETPISTPFRRRLKDIENKPDSAPLASEDEATKTGEELQDQNQPQQETLKLNRFELPKNFADLASMQVLPIDKLTTSWSNVGCSASIAVQVNLDEQSQEPQVIPDESMMKSTEISTQTDSNNDNEDDNDGQLFYIPLQAVTRNGPNLVQGQQLIQGVAVKLGTEGPTGPNQRVLLRAKLVTKPPSNVARCPPVGTVQPTARVPQSPTASITDVVPSTSASTSTPSTSSFQHPLANRNVAVTPTTSRQNVATGTTANLVAEKVQKSPKPSRERKTSIDSVKSVKRPQSKSKQKAAEFCSPTNSTTFPSSKNANEEARLVEAPTFHPTEKDFQDPLEYIDKIRPIAEKFGICRVVPPPNFKPECKVSDDMRFTAYNQYVHRMLHRWGPNVKEMMAIKKYLATQSITLTHPPWIGGMEVDLPHLYQTVQSLGGLKEVIEKKKWQKVADGMKIPKSAQDRVTKLDDIYCKYLLPYDTLSPEEREKLFDEVETDWAKRESKAMQSQTAPSSDNDAEDDDEDSSDETEECIVKGRNMPLNAFYRIARNTQRMWFGESQPPAGEAEGASANDVETAFWKHVAERKRHVCVHAASIDSSGRGFGFSVAKNSPFARHPWNLKVLTNNAGSVLRALGPLMGVTVPTLHVGMLFSACCWYRDPHGLPWIEYLHTGAKKIWYGIPDEHSDNFRDALSKMVPRYCKSKTIWLPSDTAMVPPELLVKNGVPLCQTVQEPGQFIIVFPKAFTSSICTGYLVSESVYFAQSSWLVTAEQVFKDIQESCEPSIFSFERLLFSIINDTRSHVDVLKQILPTVMNIRERELEYRRLLEIAGLTNTERLPLPDSGKRRRGKKVKEDDGDFECETCRANLFVSLISNSQDDVVYCLPHACQILTRKKQLLKHCTLMYTYSEVELDDLIHKLEDKIEAKSKKTNMRQAK